MSFTVHAKRYHLFHFTSSLILPLQGHGSVALLTSCAQVERLDQQHNGLRLSCIQRWLTRSTVVSRAVLPSHEALTCPSTYIGSLCVTLTSPQPCSQSSNSHTRSLRQLTLCRRLGRRVSSSVPSPICHVWSRLTLAPVMSDGESCSSLGGIVLSRDGSTPSCAAHLLIHSWSVDEENSRHVRLAATCQNRTSQWYTPHPPTSAQSDQTIKSCTPPKRTSNIITNECTMQTVTQSTKEASPPSTCSLHLRTVLRAAEHN